MSLDFFQNRPGMATITPQADSAGNAGGLSVGQVAGFAPATATSNSGGAVFTAPRQKVSADIPTLTNGATITHNNAGAVITTNGGAVTGIIVQAGTIHGQSLTILNNTANTVTMAAVGTSNVAGGVAAIVPANAALNLIWNAIDSRWYDVG